MNKHERASVNAEMSHMIDEFLSIAEDYFRRHCSGENWRYFVSRVEWLRPDGQETAHDRYGIFNPKERK